MEGIHRVATSGRRWCAARAMRAAQLAVCTRGSPEPSLPGCSAHVTHVARAPGTVHVAHFSNSKHATRGSQYPQRCSGPEHRVHSVPFPSLSPRTEKKVPRRQRRRREACALELPVTSEHDRSRG